MKPPPNKPAITPDIPNVAPFNAPAATSLATRTTSPVKAAMLPPAKLYLNVLACDPICLIIPSVSISLVELEKDSEPSPT